MTTGNIFQVCSNLCFCHHGLTEGLYTIKSSQCGWQTTCVMYHGIYFIMGETQMYLLHHFCILIQSWSNIMLQMHWTRWCIVSFVEPKLIQSTFMKIFCNMDEVLPFFRGTKKHAVIKAKASHTLL